MEDKHLEIKAAELSTALLLALMAKKSQDFEMTHLNNCFNAIFDTVIAKIKG